MRWFDECVAFGVIFIIFIGGSFIGSNSESSDWEDKIKTQGVIEVDGKHYKIKEVVLFKTYKEK